MRTLREYLTNLITIKILLGTFILLFITSCFKEVPEVDTKGVTDPTRTSAISGGDIIDDGGAEVTACGVCWSATINWTNPDFCTTDNLIEGSFTSNITGLIPGKDYYVRAYADNSRGRGYGKQVPFSTKPITKAIVTTLPLIETITSNSARAGGIVMDDGGSSVTQWGICWYTKVNPNILFHINSQNGNSTDTFYSNITGLYPDKEYKVKAYAINSIDTAYGDIYPFKTAPPDAIDNDGHSYKIIRIDTQLWMMENLKTTKLNDGTAISNPLGNWDYEITPAYCWYENNNNTYENPYGALYNWDAVNTGKLCPTGWHVPTDTEWVVLTNYLGGANVAGRKMKETGTLHWQSSSSSVTNSSGFTGLPGGKKVPGGQATKFYGIESEGYYWSATPIDATYASYRLLADDSDSIKTKKIVNKHGLSVRCIKDSDK